MAAPVVGTPATKTSGTSSVAEIAVDMPAGAVEGDLLVLIAGWRTNGVISLPSVEWTDFGQQNNDGAGTANCRAGALTLGAAEPDTYTSAKADTTHRALSAAVPVSGHGGVEDVAFAAGTGSSMQAPSVDSAGADRLLLVLWFKDAGGDDNVVLPGTMTEVYGDTAALQNSGGNNSSQSLGASEVVGAGATGARTATMDNGRRWAALSLVIAPSSEPDPPDHDETPAADEVGIDDGGLDAEAALGVTLADDVAIVDDADDYAVDVEVGLEDAVALDDEVSSELSGAAAYDLTEADTVAIGDGGLDVASTVAYEVELADDVGLDDSVVASTGGAAGAAGRRRRLAGPGQMLHSGTA